MPRTVKLAYDLKGNPLNYNSEDANVRLKVKVYRQKNKKDPLAPDLSLSIEHREFNGLPFIEYNSYNGRGIVPYLPKRLEERIERDLEAGGIDKLCFYMIVEVFSKESAKTYAKLQEWWYKELPPARDGKLLSTRMSF